MTIVKSFLVFAAALAFIAASVPLTAQCVDYSKDPAGCQPALSIRRSARCRRCASIAKARWIHSLPKRTPARASPSVEKELHLFRNIEHLHWVLTVPSVKDSATGEWKGGDLDGGATGAARHRRQLHLHRSPERRGQQACDQHFQNPARSREAAAGAGGRDPRHVRRQPGFRRPRTCVRWSTRRHSGEDRYILVRNAGTNTSAGWRRTAST